MTGKAHTKRARDVNQLAKQVADLATEIGSDEVGAHSDDQRKDPAAVQLGRKGGLRRLG